MKTIKNNVIKEIIIKKSKFITILERFDNEIEISNRLNYYKNLYPNANHYCYAYIVSNKMHYSDDGEPSGTAGVVIHNVLNKNELSNVLCIVIRYFGGIKLGANGLVRAYTNAAKAFNDDDIVDLIKGMRLEITFDYDNTRVVDNLLKNSIKLGSNYDDDITYELLISSDEYDKIKNEISMITKSINLKENVFITK